MSLKSHMRLTKPLRFPMYESSSNSMKRFLTPDEVDFLENVEVVIEEKMDGKRMTFKYMDYFILAEDLSVTHSIPYRIPARFAIFDILYVGSSLPEYLPRDDWLNLYFRFRKLGVDLELLGDPLTTFPIYDFFVVPEVYRGFIHEEELPYFVSRSYYADSYMEGIVVKPNMVRLLSDPMGKYVRPEFEDGITEHYLKSRVKKHNVIDPNIIPLIRYNFDFRWVF